MAEDYNTALQIRNNTAARMLQHHPWLYLVFGVILALIAWAGWKLVVVLRRIASA